jgi:peptidoglycan hydrolase CwlO-like protein
MPSNTNSRQDRVVSNAQDEADTLQSTVGALLEIIDELDNELTKAKTRIEELENEE